MSSSISSSDFRSKSSTHGKMICRVALVVLAFFVALEIFTRQVLLPNSLDFARFASYPAAAETLCQQPGQRLAFVGNSATQRGIDPKRLGANLADSSKPPIHAEYFLVDGSMINTWH